MHEHVLLEPIYIYTYICVPVRVTQYKAYMGQQIVKSKAQHMFVHGATADDCILNSLCSLFFEVIYRVHKVIEGSYVIYIYTGSVRLHAGGLEKPCMCSQQLENVSSPPQTL